MLRHLISLSLLTFAANASARAYAAEPTENCSQFAWVDSDSDGLPDRAEGEYYCPVTEGTEAEIELDASRYIPEDKLQRNADGSVAVDCAANDPSRTTLMTVWKDFNQNGYSPEGAAPEVLCLYPGVGISHPTIDYKTIDKLGYTLNDPNSRPNFDCNDTYRPSNGGKVYELSFPYYNDNDSDGYGALPASGQTCDTMKSRNYLDCNDSDPEIMATWQKNFPDAVACEAGRYQLAADDLSDSTDGKKFEIILRPGDLLVNADPAKAPAVKTVHLFGSIYGVRTPTVYAGCLGNCPSWSMTSSGIINWRNIDVSRLTPEIPFPEGGFHPNFPASFKVKMLVSDGFQKTNGYNKVQYLRIKYVPTCDDLLTYAGRMKVFNSGIAQASVSTQSGFQTQFSPKCSNGADVRLEDLAKAMGVDHFNFSQAFREGSASTFLLSQEASAAWKSGQNAYGDTFQLPENGVTPEALQSWLIDPPMNSMTRVIANAKTQNLYQGFALDLVSDSLPYYFDEGSEGQLEHNVRNFATDYALRFADYPRSAANFYSENAATRFKLYAVGVKSDGSSVKTSVARLWESSNESAVGSQSFSLRAGPIKPSDWSQKPDSIRSLGVEHDGASFVPPLVGKDPNQEAVIAEYLKDTGFQLVVKGTQASELVPAGLVILQSPAGDSVVSAAGIIEVIVSRGPPKACGDLAHGQTTSRIRYRVANVPFGAVCDNVTEVQTATCSDGELVFSGTATNESCTVMTKPPVPAVCVKTAKKICKAGLLESKDCALPAGAFNIKKDLSYKGSLCHEVPKKLTLWNLYLLINSYELGSSKVRTNLGCHAQFEYSFREACKD